MKIIILTLLAFILSLNISQAQFKKYDDKGPSTYNTGSNKILGFINPNNFTMNHSFNVSMVNSAYGNVSLTSYINSMNYQISERFNINADVKVQYSPFASSNLGQSSTALQNDLSGVFLSRASMNYKISDNSFINIEYRNINEGDYMGNYYNPFYGNNGFYNSGWR